LDLSFLFAGFVQERFPLALQKLKVGGSGLESQFFRYEKIASVSDGDLNNIAGLPQGKDGFN
jgi:hypothetical protein